MRMAAITASDPVLQNVIRSLPVISQNSFRDLARERRLRTQFKALMDLLDQRVANEIRRVAEGGRAKAIQQIDIDIAIDVPKLRALGADGDDRIDDFLPFRMKSGGDPGIGEHRPRCLGHFLGTACAPRVAFDQIGEESCVAPRRDRRRLLARRA